MRSVATILLTAASALALAACGGSNESSSSTATAPAAETAAVEPAPAESAPAETAPAETAAVEPAAVETSTVADASPSPHSDAMMPAADAAAPAADGAVIPAAATAAAGEDYAAFTGNADAGKKVFVKCLACHSVVAGQNKVGPSLYGIVGRQAGSIPGFNYSAANKNSGITWTEQVMFEYLKAPQQYIKGTKMVFPGLPSGQDRADVIAYLKSVSQ